VLDGDFRVRGTKNLRIVDASVFPHIPGTFIVLPIYMISEKAATVIIAEARGAATGGADLMPSTVPATNSSARGGIL
jgi:choline dehydrogenase